MIYYLITITRVDGGFAPYSLITKSTTKAQDYINKISLRDNNGGKLKLMLVGYDAIRKIMKEDNLICRRKKAFKPVTTQSNHDYKIYPNLIKNIEVTGLNQVWVADITYIQLVDEFIYLATIEDIFSRKCVGWALSRDINTILTLNALEKATMTKAANGTYQMPKLITTLKSGT